VDGLVREVREELGAVAEVVGPPRYSWQRTPTDQTAHTY
jgi:hypothetical protein